MNLRDFLGGSPLQVLIKLALLSLLVGVVLTVFGITPRNFFSVIDNFFRLIYDLGFASFEWVIQYLTVGAMVVVPIWLIVRLLRARPSNDA